MSGTTPYRTWPVRQNSTYSEAPSAGSFYGPPVSPGESVAGSVFSSSSAGTQMTVPPHPSFAGIDGEYYHPYMAITTLPCEFQSLEGCQHSFGIDQQGEWITHHSQDHLREQYPLKLRCPLCDQFLFDARKRGVSPGRNFWDRMEHWAYHYSTGEKVGPPRVDHLMMAHVRRLKKNDPRNNYSSVSLSRCQQQMEETEMPPEYLEAIADGAQPRNFMTDRDRLKYRRDNQVMVDPAREERQRRKHRGTRH